jgi:hypothetical protein
MPQLVKLRRSLAGALLVIGASLAGPPALSQSTMAGEGFSAMVAVMRYRLSWLEDRTPFDPCSLSGQSASAVDSIPADVRELVGTLAGGTVPTMCADPAAVARALPPRVIRVQSVTPGDSVAQVRLHVRKGDHSHTEDYTVRRTPLGGWQVAEVRTWGHLYAIPAQRPERDE